MLDLGGSEGGGQLVRTALACSALAGEPFRMTRVRGARPDPGLRPQHLVAVRAVASVCDATVAGDEEGSEELVFEPGPVTGGVYEVDVGTAGSVPLVLDAVLPVAYGISEPLDLRANGGTDVKWTPTADHQRGVKLPLVRRAGLEAEAAVLRRGFYPAGGGEMTLSLSPSVPRRLELVERGRLQAVNVASVASRSLADPEVAERQAEAAVEAVEEPDLGVTVESRIEYADSDSPGSAVLVRAEYDGSLAGFDALGERGKPAEEVGEAAASAFRRFHVGDAAVDEHTADQLVLPLAVAGGTVTVPRVTGHVSTATELVRSFGAGVEVDAAADGPARVVAEGGLGTP